MTRFLLLRHAAHDLAGRALAGRMPGLGLNAQGRREAQELAQSLRSRDIAAIYSSPQQRTRETAQPIAQELGLAVRIAPEFDEIDFGEWTGLAFDEVKQRDPVAWSEWVDRRSGAVPPRGEAFARVVQRAGEGLRRLAREHPGQVVLVVSHADVIKCVIAQVLGMSMDDLERFEIGCALLSVVDLEGEWVRVALLNAPLEPQASGSPPSRG